MRFAVEGMDQRVGNARGLALLPLCRDRDRPRAGQRAEPLGEGFDLASGLDLGKARLGGRVILERFAVEGMDLLLLADAFVAALAGLIAQPFAIDHLLARRKGCMDEAVERSRVVGNSVIEVAGDVQSQTSRPTMSEQAVAGAFGQADKRAGEEIDLFDGEIEIDGEFLDGGTEEAADAVGDEVGGVLTGNDTLSETAVVQ